MDRLAFRAIRRYRAWPAAVAVKAKAKAKASALAAGLECVRDVASSVWCKSSPWEVTVPDVAEGNCVAAMRGGEQPEVNEQPVQDDEPVSAAFGAASLLQAKGEAWTFSGFRFSDTLQLRESDVEANDVVGGGMLGRRGKESEETTTGGVNSPEVRPA